MEARMEEHEKHGGHDSFRVNHLKVSGGRGASRVVQYLTREGRYAPDKRKWRTSRGPPRQRLNAMIWCIRKWRTCQRGRMGMRPDSLPEPSSTNARMAARQPRGNSRSRKS